MKELEDQPWFPALLRQFQTDHIGYVATRWPGYDALLPLLMDPVRVARAQVDLCSGSGEPAITVHRLSLSAEPLTLTDLYPRHAFHHNGPISYDHRPLDVRMLKAQSSTCYTMFNAFHHFSDAEKLCLVHKLRAARAEAFLVEVLEPRLWCLLKVLVATTVGTLLLAPFVRPFSSLRLFFTYIVPVNVLTITWDGVISVLRSRTAAQYKALFAADPEGIVVHRLPGRLQRIIVIQLSRP